MIIIPAVAVHRQAEGNIHSVNTLTSLLYSTLNRSGCYTPKNEGYIQRILYLHKSMTGVTHLRMKGIYSTAMLTINSF